MIQTTINGIATVSITPIQAQYIDPVQCTTLSVIIQHDNLLDTCSLHWTLMYPIIVTNPDSSTTTTYTNSISGNVIVTSTDYTNWTGDSTTPFTFTATQLNLTITS